MKKKGCSDCRYQVTGWDGGFFGLPLTCECRIFGETENRKDCTKWEKRLTRDDLLGEIAHLRNENEQLRQENTALESNVKFFKNQLDKIPESIRSVWIE